MTPSQPVTSLDALIARKTAEHAAANEAKQAQRDAEREEYLAGLPALLETLDALLTPIEEHAKTIDDGLEQRAKEREKKETRTRVLYVTPDHGELPRDWEGVRAHPEVASLIAEGWRLSSVEYDFAGRRVAALQREAT